VNKLLLIFFFIDPREFSQYDTNRDDFIDSSEYASGEVQECQCKMKTKQNLF
jgi:hypothetical protein